MFGNFGSEGFDLLLGVQQLVFFLCGFDEGMVHLILVYI
jgi:hypothetical protein